MKILCISDQVDALVYSASLKDRYQNVDLVVGAGDLPLGYYDFVVSTLNKPLLFVFGNHQLTALPYYRKGASSDTLGSGAVDKVFFGGTYMDRRVKRVGNLLFAGLGGSRWYNGGKNQFHEWQMALKMVRMIPRLLWSKIRFGRYVDVLITHAAPFGVGDRKDHCHRGFKCFLWFIRRFRPRYVIHGHIHLYGLNDVRERQYQDTRVVNASGHCLLDIEE
jgi:Icc-related predicted phosphoesterase